MFARFPRIPARHISWIMRSCAVACSAMAAVACCALAAGPATAAASGGVPPNPVWQSSAPFGAWNDGGYIVYNNEWNTSLAGPQTIWADSFHHWGVSSDQAATTAVKTYPCVQQNYQNPKVTSLTYLRSAFGQSMPKAAGLDAEAAYDIWLNNYDVEVMIWVDNHRQTPAGHVVAHVKIYGQMFALYRNGDSFYSFKIVKQHETSGRAHLLSALEWLQRHGYIGRSDTLTQVDFGWEIASTVGRNMDFTVTRYWLATGFRKH
jgi:hypothetical protein